MGYYVWITYADGGHATLCVSSRRYGSRVIFGRAQAYKHAKDCRKMMSDGKRPDWRKIEVLR